MAWIYLIIAGFFECGWALGLKYAEGFSKLRPSIFTVMAMAASFLFLSLAVKTIPVGTAYAVWTGIGAVCVAVVGIILFDEPRDLARIVCIFLIVIGVVGLKIFSGRTAAT